MVAWCQGHSRILVDLHSGRWTWERLSPWCLLGPHSRKSCLFLVVSHPKEKNNDGKPPWHGQTGLCFDTSQFGKSFPTGVSVIQWKLQLITCTLTDKKSNTRRLLSAAKKTKIVISAHGCVTQHLLAKQSKSKSLMLSQGLFQKVAAGHKGDHFKQIVSDVLLTNFLAWPTSAEMALGQRNALQIDSGPGMKSERTVPGQTL